MKEQYLSSVKKQFEYYKVLGEKTFEQLEEQELYKEYSEGNNSIAIIVNHLWGNMKSRWTDFLISDGEKEWRNREEEFEDVIKSKEVLMQRWNDGWECLFVAIDSINADNFYTEIYIRNQAHSIIDAMNRQLAHYSYHVGQIVFIGKMAEAGSWKSLSIPKGQSSNFNKEKFAKGKHKGHFTDDIK